MAQSNVSGPLGITGDGNALTATATSGAATLNEPVGAITSESLTTAAGSDYALTLTNNLIAVQIFERLRACPRLRRRA